MASIPASPDPQRPVRPLAILYNGSAVAPPRQVELRAGPLRLLFEPELAQIRHLRIGPLEVLRAVYGAVRDRNWNTLLPRVSGLIITTTDEGFSVRFTAECRNEEVHFVWQGELDGHPNGELRYRFRGKALNTFLRNRIGFCVLHDGEKLPGRAVRVEHVDGSTSQAAFPLHISPHQPFFDIRAITYRVWDGLDAEVRMEGDTFEMEDQRNWTDASFKTYSTPLGLPFPVEVAQGTEVEQTVTFRLIGDVPRYTGGNPAAYTTVKLNAQHAFPLPPLGACLAEDAPHLNDSQAARLQRAGVAHLRVDLKLYQPGWRQLLARARTESALLGVPLELALHLSSSAAAELAQLAQDIQSDLPAVARVMVFHRNEKSTTSPWMEVARAALRPLLATVPIGSGSSAYFTEVNRGRPPVKDSDFVCWSSNPQVHAFDNLSLIETLGMYQATLESGRTFCGSLPLVVSPVTLKPRFNPNATSPDASTTAGKLPESVDPRQMSLFGAGWTLGLLKYLTRGGASSATLYETVGWRGWMETTSGSPEPELFHSLPGTVFPLYHVLADWAEFAGAEMLGCASSMPLQVEAVALRKGGRLRVLLANLTAKPLAVSLDATDLGQRLRVKTLDEHSAMEAIQQPEIWRGQPGALAEASGNRYLFSLLPYAVLRLDAVGS